MENFIKRFPVPGGMILNNLDDQSLARSKEANREMAEFIENERFYWIRIIKKYNNNWKQIINKTPIEALKELAIESERYKATIPRKFFWIACFEPDKSIL